MLVQILRWVLKSQGSIIEHFLQKNRMWASLNCCIHSIRRCKVKGPLKTVSEALSLWRLSNRLIYYFGKSICVQHSLDIWGASCCRSSSAYLLYISKRNHCWANQVKGRSQIKKVQGEDAAIRYQKPEIQDTFEIIQLRWVKR